MDTSFFLVGKQGLGETERTMGVRSRPEGGGLDAWFVPILEADRFGDYEEATAARKKMIDVMKEPAESLGIYEVKMALSVDKVERPLDLKRTTVI